MVDDERIIADTLAEILRLNQYDVSVAYSAEEALEWCRENCPGVVITDVFMGKMNGVQLAIHLADTQPSCKVLLVSGNVLTAQLVEAANAAHYHFPILPKPVHPRDILSFLAAAF